MIQLPKYARSLLASSAFAQLSFEVSRIPRSGLCMEPLIDNAMCLLHEASRQLEEKETKIIDASSNVQQDIALTSLEKSAVQVKPQESCICAKIAADKSSKKPINSIVKNRLAVKKLSDKSQQAKPSTKATVQSGKTPMARASLTAVKSEKIPVAKLSQKNNKSEVKSEVKSDASSIVSVPKIGQISLTQNTSNCAEKHDISTITNLGFFSSETTSVSAIKDTFTSIKTPDLDPKFTNCLVSEISVSIFIFFILFCPRKL